MDDFFSESKPDLINKKTMYNFEKMLKKPKDISDDTSLSNILSYIYNEYIKPNIFFIIVVVLLTLFLLYRYMTKSDNINANDNFSDTSERPIFNPNISTKDQNRLFSSDEIPLIINNKYMSYDIDSSVERPFKYPNIPSKIQDNDRAYMYDLFDDDLLINPDYYRTTNTNSFMTIQNRKDLDLLAEIIFDSSNPNKIDTYPGIEYAPLYSFY
jgi:hypothetical protein